MKPFKHLHLWLLLPFVVTLFGFHRYWGDFTNSPFRWHLHGLSATLWYVVLIVQPWLYHNRSIQTHRRFGFVGLLLAGFVAASALGVVTGNFSIPDESPLGPVKYSLSVADLITVLFFLVSVLMAILQARDTQKHARWMIATVFYILGPATTRLSFVPIRQWVDPSQFPAWTTVFAWNNILILLILLVLLWLDYRRTKKFYRAYVLVFLVQLVMLPIVLGLQDNEVLKAFLTSVMRV